MTWFVCGTFFGISVHALGSLIYDMGVARGRNLERIEKK